MFFLLAVFLFRLKTLTSEYFICKDKIEQDIICKMLPFNVCSIFSKVFCCDFWGLREMDWNNSYLTFVYTILNFCLHYHISQLDLDFGYSKSQIHLTEQIQNNQLNFLRFICCHLEGPLNWSINVCLYFTFNPFCCLALCVYILP